MEELRSLMPARRQSYQTKDPPGPVPPAPRWGVEKGSSMANYEGYCVKCREKRTFEGEKKELPNGRYAAQGTCPICGTKITRMLGKSA
jgi:hypothetical protein